MRKSAILALLLAALLGVAAPASSAPASSAPAGSVARGEYLTRVGNCAGCHSAPGAEPFSGGVAIDSHFGTFYTANLTPDAETGIGTWSREAFRAALKQGRRPDGAAMYPACPYPNFTRVRAEDIDAIYDYLMAQSPVRRQVPEHRLRFPVSSRALVRAWQWLYFDEGEFQPDPARDAQWNRGAYLVQGLGHCSACHVDRGRLGASLEGDDVPGGHVHGGWYAPALTSSAEAGLQQLSPEQGAALLRDGKAGDASLMGVMADIGFTSLQYLSDADVAAMVSYLRALPDREIQSGRQPLRLNQERLELVTTLGAAVYERECRDCHGDAGQGTVAAPALAGNRAVVMRDPSNLIRILRDGGYPPGTAGNPRPFGMPPFAALSAAELAAVATYIRTSWGNQGSPVGTLQVGQTR